VAHAEYSSRARLRRHLRRPSMVAARSISRLGLRRAGYAISGQSLSSVTNLVGHVAVASTASVEQYGAFGLASASFLFVSGVLRGLYIEPLLVRHATDPTGYRRSAWYCLSAGLPLMLVGLVWFSDGQMSVARPVWVALPTLLGLEGLRYFALGSGRPKDAFALDLAWALLLGGALAAFGLSGTLNPTTAALSWTGAGVVAFILHAVRWKLSLPVSGALRFVWTEREVSLPWGLEYFVSRISLEGLTFAIAGFYGLAGAASYRGGLVLLGPLTVIVGGYRFAAMPLFLRGGADGVMRRSVRLSTELVVLSAAMALPLFLIPDELGRALLGQSWGDARRLLVFLLAYRVVGAAVMGPLLGLRALSAGVASLGVRLIAAPLEILGFLVAVALGASLSWSIAAVVAASAVSLPLWYVQLARQGRHS
jgi:O-antigen/teichoic acid export membrane protein